MRDPKKSTCSPVRYAYAAHMDTPLSIEAVEAELATHGVSVAELCRRASMATTTWHRWKFESVEPRERTLRRVHGALESIRADQRRFRRQAPTDTAA